MELMSNSYLIFKNIGFDGLLIKNFTDTAYLPKIPQKYLDKNNLESVRVNDNMFIEKISYDIYEDTAYWDILMAINGMTKMDQLPTDFDTVIAKADIKFNKWKQSLLTLNKTYTDQEITTKYNTFIEEETVINEKFRVIYYVPVIKINELMTELNAIRGI